MSSWMKLEKGVRFDSFDHPIKYAGFTIRGQQEFDGLIAITDTLRETGASDLEIAQACVTYLKEMQCLENQPQP
jgi:hypothetical protein